MAAAPISADYSAITTIGDAGNPCENTVCLFNREYVEDNISAIDSYIVNCRELTKLWVPSATILTPEFSRLLLLGYVSATESFFRKIFRSIINTDAKAKADAHSHVVPFGAVLYHNKETIAEALLEGYSFASEKDVRSAVSKFLGVSNINDESLKSMFSEYEKICQLRHCCVHRFGKLGTQNGIALGLEQHSKALEKPLALTKDQLGEIANWLLSFAKAMNNYFFRTLLERSANDRNEYAIKWSWNYSKDKAKFNRFYKLFATVKDTLPSPVEAVLYERFKAVASKRKSTAAKAV